MDVYFVIFLVYLYICVCECLIIIITKMKITIIMVSRVCSSSMLRVSWCVWGSMSLLFDYMCMRLLFFLWFIAGVLSSQALPGFLITAPPPVLVRAVLGVLVVWIQTKQKKIQGLWNPRKRENKERNEATGTRPDYLVTRKFRNL